MRLSEFNLLDLRLNLGLQILKSLLTLVNILKIASVLGEQPLDLRVPLVEFGVGRVDSLFRLLVLFFELGDLGLKLLFNHFEVFNLLLFVEIKLGYLTLEPLVRLVEIHETVVELIKRPHLLSVL